MLRAILVCVGVVLWVGTASAAIDVPRVDGVRIDGEPDDWGDRGLLVSALAGWPAGHLTTNGDAAFRVGWDDRGLLALVEVRDDEAVESPFDGRLWEGDGVEFFVFASPPAAPTARFITAIVAPGLDPAHPRLRWRAFDQRDEFEGKADVVVEAAPRRVEGGYRVEALLPWANLGFAAPPRGPGLRLLVSVNDRDAATRVQARWFPEAGANATGRCMHEIRLADAASPPMRHNALTTLEDFRFLRYDVVADAGLASQEVELIDAEGATLQRATLTAADGRARAALCLPLPPQPQALPECRLRVGGAVVPAPPPDLAAARDQAARDARVVFTPGYVFTGTALPQPSLENPGVLRDALGAFTISVRYFDAAFNEVASAAAPGRYGAVVRVEAEGRTIERFLTLYRSEADPAELTDQRARYEVLLPADKGIDPAVAAAQRRYVGAFFRGWLAADLARDPGPAILLAGLNDLDASPGDDVHNVFAADRRYWDALRLRNGWMPPLDAVVLLPPGYHAPENAQRRWPALINLHGGWPREGRDASYLDEVEDVLKFARANPQPVIVLAPFCPSGQNWSVVALEQWYERAAAELRIDVDRVTLAGGSMGGWGAYEWAATRPSRFAALAVLCAGFDPACAPRLSGLPIRIYHGEKDEAVSVGLGLEMHEALRSAGADATLTLYPEAGHSIGALTYTPEFFAWVAAQKRKAQ